MTADSILNLLCCIRVTIGGCLLSDSLINISPDMPNTLEHYETYYQLVIMDGAELRRKAADTWSECKKIGLTPEFLDQI